MLHSVISFTAFHLSWRAGDFLSAHSIISENLRNSRLIVKFNHCSFESTSLVTSILHHSLLSTFCPCFLCPFLVFLGFSIVNAKITIVSGSSEDFAPKEEDTVTVRRLFHISTWTSTPCTLAINIIHPSLSRFLFSFPFHCLDKARRCHRSTVSPVHTDQPRNIFF